MVAKMKELKSERWPDGSVIARTKSLPWTPWALPGSYFKLLAKLMKDNPPAKADAPKRIDIPVVKFVPVAVRRKAALPATAKLGLMLMSVGAADTVNITAAVAASDSEE